LQLTLKALAKAVGLWGGVGATFISAMLVWYLLLPPQDSVAIEEWGSRLSIFWFVASGIVFSLLLDGVRRRDARYRTLFAAAGDGIARVDSMGRYREVNDRYCQLLGRMRSEFVGAHLSDMVVDVTPEYVTTINAQIAATGRATFECRLRHRDGSFPSVEMTVADVGHSERIADRHSRHGGCAGTADAGTAHRTPGSLRRIDPRQRTAPAGAGQ
jgi:PAS domain S-box-containing protein